MGFEPVRPGPGFDDDGDGEFEGAAHPVDDEVADGVEFALRAFQDEFVVDLEEELGGVAAGAERGVDAHHGELDQGIKAQSGHGAIATADQMDTKKATLPRSPLLSRDGAEKSTCARAPVQFVIIRAPS